MANTATVRYLKHLLVKKRAVQLRLLGNPACETNPDVCCGASSDGSGPAPVTAIRVEYTPAGMRPGAESCDVDPEVCC